MVRTGTVLNTNFTLAHRYLRAHKTKSDIDRLRWAPWCRQKHSPVIPTHMAAGGDISSHRSYVLHYIVSLWLSLKHTEYIKIHSKSDPFLSTLATVMKQGSIMKMSYKVKEFRDFPPNRLDYFQFLVLIELTISQIYNVLTGDPSPHLLGWSLVWLLYQHLAWLSLCNADKAQQPDLASEEKAAKHSEACSFGHLLHSLKETVKYESAVVLEPLTTALIPLPPSPFA